MGKRVVMRDNVYQTEEENLITTDETTIVEGSNNNIGVR